MTAGPCAVAALVGLAIVPLTISTPPPTTTTTSTVAPTTTTTAPDRNGVVVTNVGDETAPVSLVVPFTVGQRATSANSQNGITTNARAGAGTSTIEYSEQTAGASEVTEVAEDGSFVLNDTISSVELTQESSDPGFVQSPFNSTLLEGVPLVLRFGPDRRTTSVAPAADAAVTVDQESYIASTTFSMPGAGFPETPVGVGATWTAPSNLYFAGWRIAAPVAQQLVAVDSDEFTVSTTLAVDLATLDLSPNPDLSEISGTHTTTTTIVGSLSDAMHYQESGTTRIIATLTYTDGRVVSVEHSDEFEWVQRPA